MRFNDIFTARSIAAMLTSDPSNNMQYVGEAFFPRKKKMGIDLKWIKSHKGAGVTLKPSTYDALATIRPREGFTVLAEQMPLFRESMKVSELDMVEIQRAAEANDPYLMDAIARVYDDVANLVEGANIASERMRMSLLAPIGGDMQIVIGMVDEAKYAYNYDTDGSWKATNYEELTDTMKWDAPTTCKPLNDIQDGIDQLASKGYQARYALMNTVTLNLLIGANQMRNALITITGNPVDFLDRQTAKEIFQRKTGLIPIIYDKKYREYNNGAEAKFYPDGYVSIIADGQLGNLYMGTTPEERTLLGDAKADVSVLDTGIAVAIQNIYGPPARHETTVSQIALPSFEGMDGLYVIKAK